MNRLALVALATLCFAGVASANPIVSRPSPPNPVMGQPAISRPSPMIYVTPQNRAQFQHLQSESQALGARLAAYDARARVPTSSPQVYQQLRTEQAHLGAWARSYNAQVLSLAAASRQPAPPSRVPPLGARIGHR